MTNIILSVEDGMTFVPYIYLNDEGAGHKGTIRLEDRKTVFHNEDMRCDFDTWGNYAA